MKNHHNALRLKKLGIDTHKEAVIYMRKDCRICRSEGFEAQTRVEVSLNDQSILATLNMIEDHLLQTNEASLSTYAWELLNAHEGDEIYLSHPKPLISLSYVRSKVYGNELQSNEIEAIISDITAGRYSDIDIATFLTACAGGRVNAREILDVTRAMIETGERLAWPTSKFIVDKHCVGGLPGNRTSLIVVPIVTAFGLTMPKTSSYAITSPAGTADTMEVLAPVNLSIGTMRQVVEKENGCIVWGGAAKLSPADDILIRIARVMNLDSEGQMVASILSKKIAAGSTHIVIDVPIGATAKVRTLDMGNVLKKYLEDVGQAMGVEVNVIFTDGSAPVGRGIGPALEAKDILAILQCHPNAPQDLRDRALTLAGRVIEFSSDVKANMGKKIATALLDGGHAWKKFQAICAAQGGMREPSTAEYTHTVVSKKSGKVLGIDNRRIATIAKLAGAPQSKAAGVELLTSLDAHVEKNEPIFIIHAETPGELRYAIHFLEQSEDMIQIENIR